MLQKIILEIDLLIKNGRIYDGTGSGPYYGDIAVAGDTIVCAADNQGVFNKTAQEIIEAEGLSVSPGFIDTHSHSEFTLLADNRAEGKVFQGVTTEINGNCGMSAAPLLGDAFEHRETDLNELGIRERWRNFREYFSLIERMGLPINFATLVGHGNIRASVIGYQDKKPDASELIEMSKLLREAVSDGAIGLSTGLIYPPGVYADTDELIALSSCIKELIYTSHMRNEGNSLIEAIEETISIGRGSGIAVHISHIKTSGRLNWPKIDAAVALIEGARAEGLKVTCDRYPYIAASTDLDAVLPAWTYAGGAEEELRRIKDEKISAAIKEEVLLSHPFEDYWDGVTISSVNSESNKWMEGRTMAYISERAGKKPIDFLFELLLDEKLRVGAIFHSMNEDNLMRFLKLPYAMIGSDSSARSTDGPTCTGKPHPRGFGTFPRFIGRYSRDLSIMGLSEAIHKVTMLAAETFSLKGRGQIKNGFKADMVIFDENRIIDRAGFEDPFMRPEGINYVIVNGRMVLREGALTGVMSGRILKNGN